MLGYAYLQTAQQDRSVAAFARLFRLRADSAAAHLLAGQMMLKQEYEIQAVAEATKALTLDPNIPSAYYVLAEVAIYRGRLAEAIADLRKELSIDPNFSMAWYRLGDAYARQQECDLAIPNLQRGMAESGLQRTIYFTAERILRGALRIDPQNCEATYLLGQTLVAAGRQDEGRAILKSLPSLRQ